MAVLICVMGVFPPLLVGWWSYKQGLKGREEALKMRDDAMSHVMQVRQQITDIGEQIRLRIDSIKVPEIPTSVTINNTQLEELQKSFGNMVSARLGAFVKSGMADAEAMIEMEKKMPVTPENMGQAILGKILSKFIGD